VDRSYPFFLPLHSLVARAGDTACVEQTVQNQEPVGTLGEAGAERASKKAGTDPNRREEDQHRRHYTHGKESSTTMQANAQRQHLRPHKSAQQQDGRLGGPRAACRCRSQGLSGTSGRATRRFQEQRS